MIRPARILKTLMLVLTAIVLLLLTVLAVRILFPTGVPNRNYQQELVELSRSITPESEEAQRNADQLRRAMRLLASIPGLDQGRTDLLVKAAAEIEALDAEERAEYEIARSQYPIYVKRVSPMLDGLAPGSPIEPMWELPPDNDAFLFDVLLTDITGLRKLARWEAIRLHEALRENDVSGARAALSRLGAMHSATHPVPFAIGRLVGLAMQTQVMEILHKPLAQGELSGEMASTLLDVMREWRAQDPGASPAFRGERIGTLSFVQAIFDGDESAQEYVNDVMFQPVILKLLASERAVVDRITNIYDEIDVAVAQGDVDSLDQLDQLLGNAGGGVGGRIIELVLPAFNSWARQEIVAEVFRDAVITMLALEAFRAEKGEYPEVLAELVPDFMSGLPQDPFASNDAALGYRRLSPGEQAPVESGYLLWSVGSDGDDDGGVLDSDSLMQRDRWENFESPMFLLQMVMRNHEWEGDIPLNMSGEKFFEAIIAAGWHDPTSDGDEGLGLSPNP